MDRMENIDLIIVGAGPAGLSTAMHLIMDDQVWGNRTIVLEKAVHPRPKPCGGGLTQFGMRVLKELGIDFPIPISHTRVNNVILTYQSRKIHMSGNPGLLVFNRVEFDHYLIQQARKRGIPVHEGEAVKSLEVNQEGVRVVTNITSYWAKIVVGADGSQGIVRASLPVDNHPKQLARTLKVSTPATFTSPRFTTNSAIFDFTYTKNNLQGYFWDFPAMVGRDPAHNRGVYDSRFAPSRPRANLPVILKEGFQAVGDEPAATPMMGYPIHWFSPANQISAFRILLVGDAAGVEGLFGEGIAPALGYGKVAASEINTAFQTNDFRFSQYRIKVLVSSLGRYLLPRYILANYVYRLGKQPFFIHMLWTAGQILAKIWPAGSVDSNPENRNEK
jgi:flavin-dependent dehydrogenase